MKLSAEYEAEQKELTEFVYAEQNAVHIFGQDKADFDNFAAVIRKYVGVKELTPTIVNEFVKKIIVHAPDKSSGHRRQKVQIVWNFIGEVNLPGDSQVAEWQRKSRTAEQNAVPPCNYLFTSLSLLKTGCGRFFMSGSSPGRLFVARVPLSHPPNIPWDLWQSGPARLWYNGARNPSCPLPGRQNKGGAQHGKVQMQRMRIHL